ncbi:MAG: class I SAM-dependent methyltransferase [Terriglobales bacterium]
MDYTEQERLLRHSRTRAAVVTIVLVGVATASLAAVEGNPGRPLVAGFALLVAVLAGSLYYTPDYLHLSPDLEKRRSWGIKVRWRVIAAALIVGMLSASSPGGRATVLAATAWLAATNLVARKAVERRYAAAYFWVTDFALLATLLLAGRSDLLLGAALLAAATHLSVVIRERPPFPWAAVVVILSWGVVLLAGLRQGAGAQSLLCAAGLLSVSALGTAWCVARAQEQNAKNMAAAMRELMDFTGYSADRVRDLWSDSSQQLAKNWRQAHLDEHDAERMTEWYRQNSELYMFAISAFNLEYKRIRFNLNVLKFAQGSCLDYGAGNGELILELARRGHAATYYDVDGQSLRFARRRAQQQGFEVTFLHSKEALGKAGREHGFDTVFSFDVLEHLPDLPDELGFLCSLLNPGGAMVFNVPAGSTKAHPMHLNHNLDVRAYLQAKGLEEERSLLQGLSFRKEGRYVFRMA